MTRIIGVISAKGGVGKTTVSANLSVALAQKGHSVLVVDSNLTTPNLSFHLGIPFYETTLHDVLKNKIPVEFAIYEHHSGVNVLPASLSAHAMKGVDYNMFKKVFLNLLGKADIIIVDSPAGLSSEVETIMDAVDELLIVTNPEVPAVMDALRALKIAEHKGVKVLGVVLNKVKNHKYELKKSEVESLLQSSMLITIPEDPNVWKAVHHKTPVILHRPNSVASKRFVKLASIVAGTPEEEIEREEGWFKKLFGWLA